jgi:hypothetical protein
MVWFLEAVDGATRRDFWPVLQVSVQATGKRRRVYTHPAWALPRR